MAPTRMTSKSSEHLVSKMCHEQCARVRPSPCSAASPSGGGVSNQHVRLSIGASCIPHPEKVDKDAYFMTDDGKYLGDHLHLLL